MGPFLSTGGGPAQPAKVTPAVPVDLQKYGNYTDPDVYMQGVTAESLFNGHPFTTPMSSLYFATEQTANEVCQLLGGSSVQTQDVGASQPQYTVTIPQKTTLPNRIVEIVSNTYNAGLLANALYHGDLIPEL